MTQYTDLVVTVQVLIGDTTASIYTSSDVLKALQSSYGNLLTLGFTGEYTVDGVGFSPDLTEYDRALVCLSAATILLGGRLADPSVSMSVKSEETSYDGRGGAQALAERLRQLSLQLRKAILDDSLAAVGHSNTVGLVLNDDSPIKGML